jgi:hypothetical protein
LLAQFTWEPQKFDSFDISFNSAQVGSGSTGLLKQLDVSSMQLQVGESSTSLINAAQIGGGSTNRRKQLNAAVTANKFSTSRLRQHRSAQAA